MATESLHINIEDEIRSRTVLICHESEILNRRVLTRWLASFTDLVGIIVIQEPKARLWKRIKREIKRVGVLRFFDVLVLRLYSRLVLAGNDRRWRKKTVTTLEARYPNIPETVQILETPNPNSQESEQFLRELRPDLVLARCKNLLNERIFTLARIGTFVMHPGICPEYRNAHGCFWALATRDMQKVGMTLLRIDKGVDTGPIFGYYSYDYDEIRESHNIIQDRVVFDNLDVLKNKFQEIAAGTAVPIDVSARKSQAWGQPWMSAYWRWKRAARKGMQA